MNRRPRTYRLAILAITLLLVACNWRQLHAKAAPAFVGSLPAARVPGPGERVLVFAPHPDDEVLALGGLLYESRQSGALVKVVYLTSGDGFRLCAAAKYRGWPDQKRMRQLAVVRQAEARFALAKLQVSPTSAVFLGYPDRGLDSLWLSNWNADTPYRSPHTNESAVSSPTHFRKGAPFCGEAVLDDISALLSNYRPDLVLYPDSTDDHPDHWAAHCLVQLALERGEQGKIRPRRRTYLIHRGEWPEPMRSDPRLALVPPGELRGLGARWEQVSLSPNAITAKREALNAYSSQQALTGRFLNAFVRRNELLTHWPDTGSSFPVARAAAPSWRYSNEVVGFLKPPPAPSTLLNSAPSVLEDSTKDRFARARCGAVDFAAMVVNSKPDAVRLAAVLRRPVVAWATYDLYWKPVSGPLRALKTRRYRLTDYRCWPETARFEIGGKRLEVTIPRQELGGTRQIMVSAASWSGPALLDRTPWRLVTVSR